MGAALAATRRTQGAPSKAARAVSSRRKPLPPGPDTLLGTLLGQRRTGPLETALAAYRENLRARTFELRHAWMKDGQTLGEIMVPVTVERPGAGGGIEHLRAVLTQVFGAARTAAQAAPRIAIIGGPGSGKSVALRLIARAGWDLPVPTPGATASQLSRTRGPGSLLLESKASALARPSKAEALDSSGGAGPDLMAVTPGAGRLLVLIDALDELDLPDRAQAARALNGHLGTWPHAPFVITCRTAAWQDPLTDPRRVRIDMAPFHPAAIRQFVGRWRFAPPKSADELLRVIARQPHVADLARNPLMLTIVCYLYDQPKYRLPDNRAQFYEVCSRALLEEWDQTQSRDRANQFDRPHKEILLAALAYAHITGEDPARDIDEDWALARLAAAMDRALGLDRAGNHKLLEELVQNAGLLVRLPPNGLRFPHQTFLEFFAAAHLLAAADLDGLLARYAEDPGRWREVLLLSSGLCTQPAAGARILATLLDRGALGLALTALTEARVVDPATAGLVLDAAARDLAGEPEPQVIASLGDLAANPLTTYGTRAADLLHGLLRTRGAGLPGPLLQKLLLAALRRASPELTTFLIDNLERLDLGRILPAMAEDALLVSAAVLRQTGTPLAKRCEWIDGLRRAQAVGVLFDLEGRDWLEPGLRHALAVALARCSTLDDFWTLVDRPGETADQGADVRPRDAAVLARWGWPYQPPMTERGRLLCCRFARHLSREISEEGMDGVHPRLGYLACALAVADGRGGGWDWEPAEQIVGGRAGALRAIWRRAAQARWAGWVGERVPIFCWPVLLLNGLITSLLIGSLVAQWMGWSDLGVPWPPAVIGLFIAGAEATWGAYHWKYGDYWLAALVGAVWPLASYPKPPTVGLIQMIARRGHSPRASVWIAAIGGCVLPLALFIAAPAGMLLKTLLGLAAVVQPLMFVAGFAKVPTHPLISTDSTQTLFNLLREPPTPAPKPPAA